MLSTFSKQVQNALGADGEYARVQLSGPEVELEAETAQVMALALHELATNALKHGALGQQGSLSVSWQIDGRAAKPRLGLDWRESGVVMPPEAPRRSTGFGRTLIETALPYDLGAKTRLDFTPTGVCCRIELPLGQAGGSR